MPDGREVHLVTLTAASGESVAVTDLGASMVSLWLDGVDVVLGYDTAEEYLKNPKNVGATVGRYANRIACGRFPLEGQTVQVSCNRPPHSIHGGNEGFDRKLWKLCESDEDAIVLELVSPDGDEGFPGTLTARAEYRFPRPHVLSVCYTVKTDKTTVCSLANHSYWNLEGHDSGKEGVCRQKLTVFADAYAQVDAEGIPSGKLTEVSSSSFDLRQGKYLADILAEPELVPSRGLDHCYALPGEGLSLAARAEGESRVMEVWTDLPAMQVYTGGNLPEGLQGKNGAVYGQWSAYCLETQQFPDAPNHPEFPSAVLRPGETRDFRTEYRFYRKDNV